MAEPKVLAFVCNWCAYGAADGAGSAHLAYPAGVRLVRVNCSGRVSPELVIEAFRAGADGVMVLGCHPGDCHYRDGNRFARNRVVLLQRWLAQAGIDPRRLRIDWASSREGERFARIVDEFFTTIRGMNASPAEASS